MTNQQHKLIQDVKDLKEKTSLIETKYNSLDGLFNVINKAIIQNAEGIDNNIEDIDFLQTEIRELKKDKELYFNISVANAILTLLLFIGLVLTVCAL